MLDFATAAAHGLWGKSKIKKKEKESWKTCLGLCNRGIPLEWENAWHLAGWHATYVARGQSGNVAKWKMKRNQRR